MLVQTFDDVCKMVRELEGITHIAVDLETTGLDLLDSEVTGIGFASSDKEWYIDIPSLVGYVRGYRDTDALWGSLLPLFDVTKHILISHNTPFDMAFVVRELEGRLGSHLPYFPTCDSWWDTLSMAALVDENLIGVKVELPTADGATKAVGALSLKALSQVFLGRKQRLWDASFDSWTVEEKAEYGCADVRNCYDLAVFFSKYLDKIGLMDYYVQYVAPMSYVTCAMEVNGIKVDVAKLLEVQQSIEKQVAVYAAEVQDIMPPNEKVVFDLSMLGEDPQPQLHTLVSSTDGGEFLTASGKVSTSQANLTMLYNLTPKAPFWQQVTMLEFTPANPRSNVQLGEYLVNRGYRLPLTKTGKPSVSEEVLQIVAKEHPSDPLWATLFKMRKLEKLKGTYVDACLNMAWEDDRVHPEWNQSGTATGRYSCTSSSKNKELTHKRGPALQTIPRPDTVAEMGWEYNPREWFIADHDKCLAVADLSQAEVRMLAVMSKDEVLKKAMLEGEDIHSNMAAATQGEKWEKGTKEERKKLRGYTKRVVFGTCYGIGPQALSEDIGCTVEEAKALLDKFYSTFKGVSDWKSHEAMQLSRNGYVTSFLGRRRTPVLVQKPPRVTAPVGTPEREQQKLQEALWMAEYDFACEKSGFDPATSEETERKARSVRQAINFEIQGSVAELVNYGLVGLLRKGYKIIGQVHDEILVEILDTEAARDQFEKDLRGFYEAELNGVPFVVDLHFGSSWACGKE